MTMHRYLSKIKGKATFVHERFPVGDDVGMLHLTEDFDFIKGVFPLLFVHPTHFDHFHCVQLLIDDAFH